MNLNFTMKASYVYEKKENEKFFPLRIRDVLEFVVCRFGKKREMKRFNVLILNVFKRVHLVILLCSQILSCVYDDKSSIQYISMLRIFQVISTHINKVAELR